MDSNLFGGFDDEPQIDLTPLIDCLFMLIIFFVLTMSFSRPVLEVVLPRAEHAAEHRDRSDIALSVKADGSLWLSGEPASLDAVAAALDREPERLLNIFMDERAPFASFVAVMDLAKAKREGRFVVSTRPGAKALEDAAAPEAAP